MLWTRAARSIAAVRLSFASPVVRLTWFMRWHFSVPARRRMHVFACWCVEIGAGLSHDPLAKAGSQTRRLNFLYRAVLKIAQLERTKCDADQSIHS